MPKTPKNFISFEEWLRNNPEVDVDVLLSDGRVFSYYYVYGSCSGCDEWEARNLSCDEIESVIMQEMQEATIFNDLESYNQWRENVKAKA